MRAINRTEARKAARRWCADVLRNALAAGAEVGPEGTDGRDEAALIEAVQVEILKLALGAEYRTVAL